MYKHGHARSGMKTSTWIIWKGMISRCGNPNFKYFHFYGGRGIRVCERWLDFTNFLSDMGVRPEGKSIGRFPNNDGNYEPGNCRWATAKEQANNRRLSTHCKKGHPWTVESTGKNGHKRRCRLCNRAWQKARRINATAE